METLHIYLRVSSDTQISSGFGIENQKEVGIKLSQKLGMNYQIWNEGSKSSFTDDMELRPQLTHLMSEIEKGSISNLYVYNNDRLSRNENVWGIIRKKLRDNNVTLYVGEGTKYDLSSSMDDFIFGVLSEVTKYDNNIRTERLRRGKLSKIKGGGWKGGPPPFGYQLEKGRLVEEPKESKWVKFIFEEYSDGRSIKDIQTELLRNGVQSRRGNVIFSLGSIRNILNNTHYGGYYTYTDTFVDETVRCEVPSLLPPSLIQKVNERLERSTYTSNHRKVTTLLNGYLYCKHCGYSLGQRINKTQYRSHYFCRTSEKKFKDPNLRNCTPPIGRVRSLLIEDTDSLVWETILKVINESHLFREQIKTEVMDTSTTKQKTKDEITKIKKRMKSNDDSIKKLNEVMNEKIVEFTLNETVDGKSLIQTFEQKKRELEIENQSLMEEINDKQTNTQWVDWVMEFRERINSLQTDQLTVEEKRKFIEPIVDRIYVSTIDQQTHQLEILFKSPIVDDGFEWKDPKNRSKGYHLSDGTFQKLVEFHSEDRRLKKGRRI